MRCGCFFLTRQECRVPFGIRPSVQHLWPYSREAEVVAFSDERKYIKFTTAYPLVALKLSVFDIIQFPIMIFSTPLAAFGLLITVVLTAVYCFRRKSPPRVVSSLMLWPKAARSTATSRRRDKLLLPPIFWLELLALTALVVAALTPLVWRKSSGTLHVLLDDSPSMHAGVPSAANRADAFLSQERKRGTKDTIRVRTFSTDAALDRALATLRASLPPGDECLVLTDRLPVQQLPSAGIRWEAFGIPQANYAITAARRLRKTPTNDSLFLEVRRFGDGSDTLPLVLEGFGTNSLAFDATGRARFVTTLPANDHAVVAHLPDDALAADNTVTLAPPNVPRLVASLDFTDKNLETLVHRALDATGFVTDYTVPEVAALFCTDKPDAESTADLYRLVFTPGGTVRERAPVWTDPGSELLAGVSFEGEPFALAALPTNAQPIAHLGTKPLVAASAQACHLAFADPALPFFRTPAFPSLIQNVCHAVAALDDAQPVPSVNLLDVRESDLTALASASLGASAEIPDDIRRSADVAWIPALLALLALAIHLFFIRRKTTLLVLALALLALARPVLPQSEHQGTLIVVADRSRSMPPDARETEERLIADLAAKRPDKAQLAVISAGATAVLEKRSSASGFEGFLQDVDPDGSDIAAALAQASSLIDPASPTRLLVISDGLFTTPSETAGLPPVDTCLLTRPFAHDLFVSRIDAPSVVQPGDVIPITAWVQSPETTTNAYSLLKGTNVLARGTRVFREGLSPLLFRDLAGSGGLPAYTLIVSPSVNDPTPENNRANFLVKTEGRRQLLHLKPGDTFDGSLSTLANYAGVILENVPAKTFTPAQLRDLAAFVTDLGNGLALTGGEQSFGPGGWYQTPVEEILPVTLELRQEHRKYALALAIVMDRSGSMACPTESGRPKMDMANLGAAGAIDILTPMDQVAVLAVDSAPHIILNLQDAASAQSQRGKILGIKSMGGGIFVEEGLLAGFRQLENATSPLRHVILFADAADAEEPGEYETYLAKARAAGITVSVIALGHESDSDAELLKKIAAAGGGECWFEANAEEIPRLFLQDTFLTAKTAMCTNLTPLSVTASLRTLSDRLPAKLPPIGGYNLTYLRPEGDAAILTQDADRAPLLATRRVGLGRTLAFAGELAGPHAAPLMTSAEGAEIAAAITRFTRGEDELSAEGFTFEQTLVPGGLRVTAIADEDNPATAVSNAGLTLVTVKDRPGVGATRDVAVLRWESSETLAAFVPLRGNEVAFPVVHLPSGAPYVLPPARLPYPAEFRRGAKPSEGKEALLRLSQRTGGRLTAGTDNLWEALPSVRRTRALAPAIYLLAAILFLILIILRRLGVHLPTVVVHHAPVPAVPRDPQKNPEPQQKPKPTATAAALAKVRNRSASPSS